MLHKHLRRNYGSEDPSLDFNEERPDEAPVALEHLLRTMLLQAFATVHPERQLTEQINCIFVLLVCQPADWPAGLPRDWVAPMPVLPGSRRSGSSVRNKAVGAAEGGVECFHHEEHLRPSDAVIDRCPLATRLHKAIRAQAHELLGHGHLLDPELLA